MIEKLELAIVTKKTPHCAHSKVLREATLNFFVYYVITAHNRKSRAVNSMLMGGFVCKPPPKNTPQSGDELKIPLRGGYKYRRGGRLG